MILDQLRRHGRASRAELVVTSGLSRATVSSLVAELLDTGEVVAHDVPRYGRRGGRPPESLTLDPAAGIVLGLDFGHRRVALVAADAAHEVLGSRSQAYSRGASWSDRCAVAVELAAELLGRDGSRARLVGCGVGVPGGIARQADLVRVIRGAVGEAFAVPIRHDNNARLAGLAETVWGAARGISDVAYLKLSNGVGGALVLGGQIHIGPRGQAGEFGHVCVDGGGPVCRCGNRGCLECYVRLDQVLTDSGHASITELRTALDGGGTRRGSEVVQAAGRRIGGVLAGVGTATDVVHVVVGGELLGLGEHLLKPIRQTLRTQLSGSQADGARVEPAKLGDYAGALGAIAQVLHDESIALLPRAGRSGGG